MLILLTGFIWGLSEATLFFLVPDIWLTWVVLHHTDKAIPTYLWTLVGALVGGTIMYLWSIENPSLVKQLLDDIPAISLELIHHSAANLNNHGFTAMLSGSFSGTPYKLYSSQAYAANISLAGFLLMTIPARLARWSILGLLTWLIKISMTQRYQEGLTSFWVIVWCLNYLVYFLIMDN